MLALLALLSPDAAALTCATDEGTGEIHFPADGATGVPTSTRVAVSTGDDAQQPRIALRLAGGDPVASTWSRTDAFGLLVPDAPLLPGAAYEVEDLRTGIVTTFTTGPDADTTAPVGGSLDGATVTIAPDGYATGYYDTEVVFDAQLGTDDQPVYYELEVSGQIVPLFGPIALFDWICTENFTFPSPPWSIEVRGRTVDSSGNAGPWSDPLLVASEPLDTGTTAPDTASPDTGDTDTGTPPPTAPCGCASTAGSAPAWTLLALLGLARRRTPRP